MTTTQPNPKWQLALAAVAAFCTYFCMYAFRKPFTAGTFANQEVWGLGLKSVLVISQLSGYMLSKFLGIKFVSELKSQYRAVGILGLILCAEVALVGFAYAPTPLRVVFIFFNGLPLGMVFGLVLAYLEGRKQTEALSAVLCASFIVSSGVVKSVGQFLIQRFGVSEFQMPMLVGLLFLPPLFLSVWLLSRTPPPSAEDRELRAERAAMNRGSRRSFLSAYWPGLALFVFVYMALTVVRTVRDDYGVEIWQALGYGETPSIFTQSETLVALCVTAANALAILMIQNLTAIRVTLAMMCAGFGLSFAATLAQADGRISPFVFMVASGVGLYVPYVAFHTTLFERLIAASRRPCNLGFLMYLADSLGYLGYAVVIGVRSVLAPHTPIFPFFWWTLLIVAAASVAGLVMSLIYFQRVLSQGAQSTRPTADLFEEPAAQEPDAVRVFGEESPPAHVSETP